MIKFIMVPTRISEYIVQVFPFGEERRSYELTVTSGPARSRYSRVSIPAPSKTICDSLEEVVYDYLYCRKSLIGFDGDWQESVTVLLDDPTKPAMLRRREIPRKKISPLACILCSYISLMELSHVT